MNSWACQPIRARPIAARTGPAPRTIATRPAATMGTPRAVVIRACIRPVAVVYRR